jgi:hypothetical protein
MSRFASSKTAKIWADVSPRASDPMLPSRGFASRSAARRPLSTRWKRKLAAKPQTSAFLRVITSGPTKDSIEIKLPEAGERLEAIGVREQPLTIHLICRPLGV